MTSPSHNKPTPNVYSPRRLRSAFVDWQSAGEWSHAITLNINRPVSVFRARSMVGLFCSRMDRYRFGVKNVRALPSAERFSAVAIIEHPDTNIHVHMAARLDSWLQAPVTDKDVRNFEKMWQQCTRGSGKLYFEQAFDPKGWLFYMTKGLHNDSMDWMFASDFHPS